MPGGGVWAAPRFAPSPSLSPRWVWGVQPYNMAAHEVTAPSHPCSHSLLQGAAQDAGIWGEMPQGYHTPAPSFHLYGEELVPLSQRLWQGQAGPVTNPLGLSREQGPPPREPQHRPTLPSGCGSLLLPAGTDFSWRWIHPRADTPDSLGERTKKPGITTEHEVKGTSGISRCSPETGGAKAAALRGSDVPHASWEPLRN